MTDLNSIAPLAPVNPVRPAAPYYGGKRLLAKRICAMIEAIPHTIYAEPFVGMGGIFLRRSMRPKLEIINDWSADVSTFFRVLQHHHVAFLDMIRWQISSRDGWEKLLAMNPDCLTDLQRSARFLYVQRQAYGGKLTGRNWGMPGENGSRFDVTKVGPMIDAIHDRLAGVVIEKLEWSAFLRRYDREGALFYLDPPYYGCEGDYGSHLFDRGQFEIMAEVLAGLSGRFIMSINDHPEIRRIFAGFDLQEINTRYSVAGAVRKDEVARELIVSGPRKA